MAESEGFEPSVSCPTPHFQCGAFVHSTISPRCFLNITLFFIFVKWISAFFCFFMLFQALYTSSHRLFFDLKTFFALRINYRRGEITEKNQLSGAIWSWKTDHWPGGSAGQKISYQTLIVPAYRQSLPKDWGSIHIKRSNSGQIKLAAAVQIKQAAIISNALITRHKNLKKAIGYSFFVQCKYNTQQLKSQINYANAA